MRKALSISILLAFAFAGNLMAQTGPVTIEIEQETAFGQSVFVGSDLRVMGGGAMVQAVKLNPEDYPVWRVTFELPKGLNFSPRFYLRSDGPNSLADSSNGELILEGEPVSTGEETWPGQRVRAYVGSDVTGMTAEIATTTQAGPIDLEFELIEKGTDFRLFEIIIPAEYVHRQDRVIFWQSNGFRWPPTGNMVLHPADTWWKNGFAYQYEIPAEQPNPSAARVETFQFNPENFRQRQIKILLPRNYDQNPDKLYPVLYAQDGQNAFSPGGAFGSWDLDLTATELIRRGEIPEIIVVAIDNTQDRIVEYIPEYGGFMGATGRGGEFLTMIEQELMPEINTRYRTLTGPENTAHLGSSLGGLLGYHAANDHSDTFGHVLAFSPSMWVNLPENLARAARPPESRARLYMDTGTAGQANDGYGDTIQVRDALLNAGHQIGPDFLFVIGLNDQHNEAAWRARTPAALRWLYRRSPESPPPTDTVGVSGFIISGR